LQRNAKRTRTAEASETACSRVSLTRATQHHSPETERG
jgi:hypothetical protein